MLARRRGWRRAGSGAATAEPRAERRRSAAPPVSSLSGIPAFGRAVNDAPGAAPAAPVPAQAPAAPAPAAPKRTITIYPVAVGSSTRDPYPDIAKAAEVWKQCNVAVKSTIGQCWNSDVLDRLAPADVLNENTDPLKPTAEETEMVSHQPGGSSVLHAFYVPRSSANNRGKAYLKAYAPDLPAEAVMVSGTGAIDTLAHEIGHYLVEMIHRDSDPDNLMAGGPRNVGVDKLLPEQCAKVKSA